ncbi:MAG: alkaline phosphatase D family protein [Parvibaculum sp.]|nr:alkaline phosphatase D family protein [Parvibaculum sp.]
MHKSEQDQSQSTGPTRRDTLMGLAAGGAAALVSAPSNAVSGETKPLFLHGVASGDPEATAIVIWTRVTAPSDVLLKWHMSEDHAFEKIVASGEVHARAAQDFTAKVDVRGLKAGGRYYYRFSAGETVSTVGATRTLASADAQKLRLGVVSCSHYGFGFFNVYKELSQQPDLDAIVHLGDYIYEYGPDGYGGSTAKEIGREHEPPHEVVTLADYRTRFAQYRRDPDLQAAHASAPFITMWDDHETANNAWVAGAQNHQPDKEGPWDKRRDAAIRTYFEWMPMRDPKPGEAFYSLHRTYEMGQLATLHTIETRLTARSEEVDYESQMLWFETHYDVSDKAHPKPVTPETAAKLPASRVSTLKTPYSNINDEPVHDYARASAWATSGLPEGFAYKADIDRFRAEVLGDPKRTLMGPAQLQWLKDGLKTSRAKGIPWQILGNQVVMARMDAPDFTLAFPAEVIAPALTNPFNKLWVERTKFRLPISPGAWDGYPAARQRLYDAVREAEANFIVLSGDSHQFWANDLRETPEGKRIGIEFATSSVSSKGGYDYLAADPRVFDIAEETLLRDVPEITYCETRRRGYILLEVTADKVHADYMAVSTVKSREYEVTRLRRFEVTQEAAGALSPIKTVG